MISTSDQEPEQCGETNQPTILRSTSSALEQLLDISRLSPMAQSFVMAITDRADLPLRLAQMALLFKNREMKTDAKALARAAHQLSPDDFRVRVLTDWLQRREAPLWHFRIVHDQLRNAAYADALRRFVVPGMIVFEIGTGTGILAMLAAQAGAAHVYTCERRQDVAATARAIIARNGLSERITVIEKEAHNVRLGEDLPQRADLFVAELVDNSLLGEGVLHLTEHARRKLLAPDAILLPRTVSAMGYLITGRGHWKSYRMDRVMGFDLTPFNRFTPIEINAGEGGGEVEPLSDAVELAHFDLRCETPAEANHRVTLIASRAGTAEAILRWLRLDFGGGIQFENCPPQRSSWDPQLHLFPQARWLNVGDRLDIEVSHNRDRLFLWPVADLDESH
jgi:type II protein arginine methyltransferase